MTINPNGTEIEFPTPICPITEPHAKHIIPGTWREQCNGVEEIKPDVTDIMEKARALVRENAGDRPHSYALGFAAHTLIAAAAGLPIDRERARLAYAVYRAAAGPAPCPHGERVIIAIFNGVEQCGREVVAWPYGECTEPTGHAGDCDRRATHRTVNHLVHPFVD